MSTYSLAGASVHDLEARNGAVYRVLLYMPAAPPPAQGWPLLLMSDGNSCFGTAVDALRAQADYPTSTGIGWGVVAALGYPTQSAYDPLRRSWDLTPPPGRGYPPFAKDGPEVRTGGAGDFLDFIETRALPFIAARAPIDAARRTFFGHSFGGLFGLYALFTRPELFQRIHAASPTIYWEDGILLESEKRAVLRTADGPIVQLSAGEYEGERLAPFQEGTSEVGGRLEKKRRERTIAYAREMAERLADPKGAALRVSFEVFPGHTHMSATTPAIARAASLAFALERQTEVG